MHCIVLRIVIRNTCIDPSAVKATFYSLANRNPSFGGLIVRVQALVRGNIIRKTPLSKHADNYFDRLATQESSVLVVNRKSSDEDNGHVEIRPGAVRVVRSDVA